MFKWIAIIFVGAIVFMIATGNMGGASKATKNYADVMKKGGDGKARPAPIHEYLKNKPKGSLY